MTRQLDEIPPITARSARCPFDPPERLSELRATRPITRMRFPDGHLGWLVTSHALARTVLSDRRFSSRAELKHTPLPRAATVAEPPPAPPGMFISMDPPRHSRYRHLLVGQFTVRRMRRLTEWIELITAEHLDAMAAHGPGADLVAAFALPIPALVISELLGVPDDDRAAFQRDTTQLMRTDLTAEEIFPIYNGILAFMAELVRSKQARPGQDLLSGLAADTDLSEEELVNIGALLLTAGHETTANMLALGAFALLRHPDQLAALRAGSVDIDNAVEELMRYLSVIPGLARTALEDVELGGQMVARGETVAVSVPAANRDPARFADPDVLDLGKAATGQLGFGYGVHQCLGQQLARVEMRVGYPALFRRFPDLRLAVPPDEVPLRTDMVIYGAHALPVTW